MAAGGWRLHRHWYDHSAMGDLLGEDYALVQSNKLYRCLGNSVQPRNIADLALVLEVNPAWLQWGEPYANKSL